MKDNRIPADQWPASVSQFPNVSWVIPHTDSNGEECLLVGYKGSSQFESGYFYCPYGPDGTDYRPMWDAERRQKAVDRGWCPKLFDEVQSDT